MSIYDDYEGCDEEEEPWGMQETLKKMAPKRKKSLPKAVARKKTSTVEKGKERMQDIERSARNTLGIVKSATKEGIQKGSSRVAMDVMVDKVRKLAGDKWPEILDEPYMRPVTSFFVATMVNLTSEIFERELPHAPFIAARSAQVMEDCVSDVTKMQLHKLLPLLQELGDDLVKSFGPDEKRAWARKGKSDE